MNNKHIDFQKSFIQLSTDCKTIGTNIVVANTNDILECHSYGLQNIDGTLATKDTIYRIASISKTIGSIGLMMLVEKGKINLDEDISTYLGYKVVNPNFPNDIITVKMITTQSSSIQDGYDDENPIYDDIHKGYNGVNGQSIDVTLQDLLTNKESIYYTPLTFGNYKPGTRFCYSNFGCGIMACIIEKVSGEYYVDYMENHVFKPLGLNASFKASHLEHQENIANMYAYTSHGLKEFKKEGFINSSLKRYALGDNFRGPAGGLFITMTDLSKLMRMFLNYGTYNGVKLLQRETVEYMYQMQWCGSPNDEYKAKGIQMKINTDHKGYPLRGHTGGAYGVRSYMFFSLKYQIGACFITNGINSPDESKLCHKIFTESIDLMLNKYTQSFKETVIYHDNEILLDERKICDKELFLADKKYIKAMALADSLNTVGIYNEDKLNFTIESLNDDLTTHKQITIEDVIYYHDNLYVPFIKTLDDLDIKYTLINNESVKLFI